MRIRQTSEIRAQVRFSIFNTTLDHLLDQCVVPTFRACVAFTICRTADGASRKGYRSVLEPLFAC